MSFKGHRSIFHSDGSTDYSWYSYTCSHCTANVSGAVVASYESPTGPIRWLLCPNCADGSVLTRSGIVHPPSKFGPVIEGLPQQVSEAYDEAKNCASVNAYTACELICRKILMYVAVEKGAQQGDTFVNYLGYLEGHGYITPPMKGWANLIRQHGNQSTHELISPNKDRAESTLTFTAELLRLIYEMEHFSNQYTNRLSSP